MIVTLVVGAIAVYVAVYFARIDAMKRYQQIMSRLYIDLDPRGFLTDAEALDLSKMDAVERVTTLVHISNVW